MPRPPGSFNNLSHTRRRLESAQTFGGDVRVGATLLADLLDLYDAFKPSGGSERADDPGCRWIRFSSADASKLYAASAKIKEAE